MTSETVSIDILAEDGTTTTEERTYYRSHYGPMFVVPGALAWNDSVAYTYRDANETNGRIGEHWMRANRAQSLDELRQVHAEVQGIPWVFTVATDSEGNAALMDGSRVPKLSDETTQAYLQALASDVATQQLAANGVVLLDGTSSRDEWVEGDKADAPGLVPFSEAPQIQRTDFAMNANDSAWLSNPAEPLTDYPLLYGAPRRPSSARTRMNLITLTETGEGSPSGADGKLSLDELQAAALSNRGIVAEDLLVAVVARCTAAPVVDVDGTPVDLTAACAVLAAWDGRLDLDRAGAVLWREMLGALPSGAVSDAGPLYQNPFDPDDPLHTPSGLAPPAVDGSDPVLEALGAGLLALQAAGFDESTTLGEAQFTWKNDEKIPIHGGGGREGVTNIIIWARNNSTLLPGMPRGEVVETATNLTVDGYVVNYGTSFIMTMEFTPTGPRGAALISYSESSDPASTHHADQTARFSDKAFRPILFDEAEILADPELSTLVVEAPR
jgi:acyl-homoserine-lactone acylase